MVGYVLLCGPVCLLPPLLQVANCSLLAAYGIYKKYWLTIVQNYMQRIIHLFCCGTKGVKNTSGEFCANGFHNFGCVFRACTTPVGPCFGKQTWLP